MGHPAHPRAPAAGASRDGYARRKPEASALRQVVRENLLTLYAAIEQGFAAPLPKFVRDELEVYVACGVFSRGFAVLACPSCEERKLVAFSCGGRGFCPSCLGRRMAQGAANLVGPVEVLRELFSFGSAPPYEELARAHGTSVSQLKSFVHRGRRRFRQLVLARVADTVSTAEEAEKELDDLLRSLEAG